MSAVEVVHSAAEPAHRHTELLEDCLRAWRCGLEALSSLSYPCMYKFALAAWEPNLHLRRMAAFCLSASVAHSALNAASRGSVHLEATPEDGMVQWCTELVGDPCDHPGLPQDTTERDALGRRCMRLVSRPAMVVKAANQDVPTYSKLSQRDTAMVPTPKCS